ncbi:MAG TPA: DinB family protein [Vicinamibacterales bacterium]|nr:DinB family protein [Vicinamibacterales bacterium]
MARVRNLLEETLEALGFARSGVIDELENIPDDQFGFRPTSKTRSVAELAQHIIESGLMATGELTRPDGSFQRRSYQEFIDEYAGSRARTVEKRALIGLLRVTLDEALAAFRKAGEAALLKDIVQFNGEPATRLTWLNHAIAHEEYHRGQLALYARLMGRVPALTQLIEGQGAS